MSCVWQYYGEVEQIESINTAHTAGPSSHLNYPSVFRRKLYLMFMSKTISAPLHFGLFYNCLLQRLNVVLCVDPKHPSFQNTVEMKGGT